MKNLCRIIPVLLLMAVTGSLIGCGSSGRDYDPYYVVTGRANGRIYITNSLDNTIDVIDARNNARVAGSPYETGGFPAGMALDKKRKRLYVANYTARTISIYNTDNMNQTAESPVALSDGPYGLYADSTGRIYAACPDANIVRVLDPDTLADVAGSPLAVGDAPYTITGIASKKQIVVANSGSASFHVFNTDTLTQINGSPFSTGNGPFGLAVDYDRNRLYVTGSDVRIYDYSNFTQLPGSPLNTRGSANKGVAIHPDSDRIWVAVSDMGQISLFNTGEMKEVADSPFRVGGSPEGVAINRQYNLLYVTDTQGSGIRIFTTGMIEATDSPLKTGNGSRQILLDPEYYGN